jgi:hypothetical protein
LQPFTGRSGNTGEITVGALPAARGPVRIEDSSAVVPASKSPAAAETNVLPAEPARPTRFVAVVFTHQERAAALSAYDDLQQRYPNVLAHHKAEVQPIEIADKGIWHRLVVLPAGSRQGAAGLCDRLEAAGYDRCWVKAY